MYLIIDRAGCDTLRVSCPGWNCVMFERPLFLEAYVLFFLRTEGGGLDMTGDDGVDSTPSSILLRSALLSTQYRSSVSVLVVSCTSCLASVQLWFDSDLSTSVLRQFSQPLRVKPAPSKSPPAQGHQDANCDKMRIAFLLGCGPVDKCAEANVSIVYKVSCAGCQSRTLLMISWR